MSTPSWRDAEGVLKGVGRDEPAEVTIRRMRDGPNAAECDALRVRLGKATELLACWQALFGDDDEEKSEGFMNETRAFLADGAP